MSGEPQPSDEQLNEGPSLNGRDEQLVIEECELQSATSPAEIQGMRDAFADTKRYAFEHRDFPIDPEDFETKVRSWGNMIDPRNAGGLRSTPVTFADGSHGLPPGNVPDALKSWAQAFINDQLTPAEAYYEFELIHPYEDGNGRVGHCIWALAESRVSGTWPTQLPPDVFGAEKTPNRPRSAFEDMAPEDE